MILHIMFSVHHACIHAGTNGSALFIFTDAARTEEYAIRIEATFGSETRVLENSVRSGINFQYCMHCFAVILMSCKHPYIIINI